jgi:hypothetical protein
MPGSKAVKERIEQLISEAPQIAAGNDLHRQRAWVVAAQHAVQLVCPSSGSPYYARSQQIVSQSNQPFVTSSSVSGMAAMLARLLEEIEGGLLTTIESRAIAVTFDDFLDHGAEYLKHDRKNEAGVIAGIVFEDTIRRICRTLDISEKGVALETLITDLAKRDVLTALKAKRARAAAGLRTSAAHARWDEFAIGDVSPVIEFRKELIEAHLG